MENKEITHWTPEEEINYNIFLIYKADELLTFKNKAPGFYVEMSAFIPSRNKVQCRSHHQKMIARFKHLRNSQKRVLQLMNLKSFYKDHLSLRLLDSKHLLKEIEFHLGKKLDNQLIDKEFYCFFKEKAEKNLSMLNFQNKEQQTQKVVKKEKQITEEITTEKNGLELRDYQFTYLFEPTEEPQFLHLVYFSDESKASL